MQMKKLRCDRLGLMVVSSLTVSGRLQFFAPPRRSPASPKSILVINTNTVGAGNWLNPVHTAAEQAAAIVYECHKFATLAPLSGAKTRYPQLTQPFDLPANPR